MLFTLEDTFLSVAVTFSPGLAVPEASTTSLVLPPDGGLKGAGPDVPSAPERSQGFGGEPAKCNYMLITSESITSEKSMFMSRTIPITN